MIFLVLILLFIVHVFCLCIVVIVFQDTSSRCIVWWQTFKLNSVAQTTLKVQLTISNISSEYWWSQIYRPHYTCWNSRLTAMHIMHPWQSPWLTKIVMSGQFCTFAMFSLIYCCDCLPASASSSFPTRSYISRPVSPVISQTYLADISAFKNQQYYTIKVEEA